MSGLEKRLFVTAVPDMAAPPQRTSKCPLECSQRSGAVASRRPPSRRSSQEVAAGDEGSFPDGVWSSARDGSPRVDFALWASTWNVGEINEFSNVPNKQTNKECLFAVKPEREDGKSFISVSEANLKTRTPTAAAAATKTKTTAAAAAAAASTMNIPIEAVSDGKDNDGRKKKKKKKKSLCVTLKNFPSESLSVETFDGSLFFSPIVVSLPLTSEAAPAEAGASP
ncbi:hypothetical protein EYF80_029280 [Liparis tanakae]|uniref:Uncharacterized protein n=1 Tax=Liparis tanakae TaxID=230148 RepID=A0A4Z2H3V2_9TELE|nr:hypothetical protein EYF80_029280 [Liparis tanakae]